MDFDILQAVIFYAIRSNQLVSWLENEQIRQAMMQFVDPDQVDADPSFTTLFDDDFKVGVGGVTKRSFTFIYGTWISLCNNKRQTVNFYPELCYVNTKGCFYCFICSLYHRDKKMI